MNSYELNIRYDPLFWTKQKPVDVTSNAKALGCLLHLKPFKILSSSYIRETKATCNTSEVFNTKPKSYKGPEAFWPLSQNFIISGALPSPGGSFTQLGQFKI